MPMNEPFDWTEHVLATVRRWPGILRVDILRVSASVEAPLSGLGACLDKMVESGAIERRGPRARFGGLDYHYYLADGSD